jgi:hypothetical protein
VERTFFEDALLEQLGGRRSHSGRGGGGGFRRGGASLCVSLRHKAAQLPLTALQRSAHAPYC